MFFSCVGVLVLLLGEGVERSCSGSDDDELLIKIKVGGFEEGCEIKDL